MPKYLLPSLLLAGLALSGCASHPPASGKQAAADDEQTNDPYESTNRFFYGVDDKLERYTLRPVAEGYNYVVPSPVRNGLHNALANLTSPVLFADDVSQANPRRAGDTFMRFVINSTAGGLGIFDVAKNLGYPAHDTNFGVTLALWGVPDGPYLYLPLVGPNSPRSLAGRGVDTALDPFSYVPHGYGLLSLNWARYGLGLLDTYARIYPDLDRAKAGALDPYATIRSLYRQNQASLVDESRHDKAETPPAWAK